MTHRLLAGSLIALFGLAGLGAAAPAQAAACSGTSGVTIVVQFPDHTETRCSPGDPSSGMAALTGAGFSVVRVQSFPGAVCRISGVPASDACVRMPPASAYWSYWRARAGGSWAFSQTGADGTDPAPGSVEGWRFGDGTAPSTKPPGGTVAAQKPTPKPTPAPTTKPKPKPSAPTSAPGTSTASSTPAASLPAGASPSTSPATTAGPSTSASSSPSPTAMAQAPVTPADPASADKKDDGGLSWIWGVGLIALLAAAGGVVAVRRRG